MAIKDKPEQIIPETQDKVKKLIIVIYACHLSYCGKHKIGGLQSRLSSKKQDHIFSITKREMES
jgi:hypothetical protein